MDNKYNPEKMAPWWEALAAMAIFTLIIHMIGERFMETAGRVPNLNMAQQLSFFFLSMLSPIFWLKIMPTIYYVTSMWHLSGIFRAISKGEEFTLTIVNGLQKAGSNLLFGACFAILFSPTLIEWFSLRGGIKFKTNSESLIILLVGAALYMIARQGEKMRKELEEIV